MDYTYDEATLDMLRLTMPTLGIIVPLLYRAGTNDIIDGRHRLKVREEIKANDGIELSIPIHHITTENPVQIDAIVNTMRRSVPADQRKALVQQLKSKGYSNRRIAAAVGAHESTVRADLAQTATAGNPAVAVKQPKAVVTKGGRKIKPPATEAEILQAWGLRDQGISTAQIAQTLERGDRTIRDWFKKDRPEAPTHPTVPLVKPEPPLPTKEVFELIEPVLEEHKPKQVEIPANLKQAHQREQKWIKERWQPIAEHLKIAHDLIRLEKERLYKEYAGPTGSLIMQRRWQQLAELWVKTKTLNQFVEITDQVNASTLHGLIAEIERSSRMANQWIVCMATYTGCKPDSNRYQEDKQP